MAREQTRDRRSERGVVMVFAALAMTALLLFAALAIDVGVVWSSRTQSQNVSDAAALAAGSKMIQQIGTNPATVELGAARAEGTAYAAANATVGNPSVTVSNGDFTFGTWNLATRVLDPPADPNDPNDITGVRVDVRMDDVANDRSPTFLAGLLGKTGFVVKNTSVAYLGFEGSFTAGEFDLPVAIDSCDLSSGGCGSDFCATIANPPNPCTLDVAQDVNGDNVADPGALFTCLEFSSTPEQNACWTVFDGDHPSVNNPDLQDVADRGNPGDTQAGDKVFLDNGDKTNTQQYIRDMFYGGDKQKDPYFNRAKGTDRYFPYPAPARSDSWVVKLPVMECQDVSHCAGGSPFRITGGVCFEIREVLAAPTRKIKGRFLCPSSADPAERQLYYQYCADSSGPQDPGGCDFGERADRLVLVE